MGIYVSNERLLNSLNRCPICGAVPNLHDCYNVDPDNYVKYEEHSYKLTCPNHHIGCGDWFDSKYEACKDWNRRTQDKTQPDFWKPKPRTGCKYCNGTLALYAETRTTKLYINTQNGASAIYTESDGCPKNALCALKGVPNRSAFIINYCPNCGRKLNDTAE